MLAILLIIPFVLSAIISVLWQNDKVHKYFAIIASFATLAIAIMLYLNPIGPQLIQWFSVAGFTFSISTTTSGIHMLLLVLVSSIAPLVLIYSAGFMRVPSEQRNYYLFLSVFTAAMLLFAIGADLITIFIAWELLGITSYLLIGFWRYKDSAISAARKAITIMLIGDVLIFAAIMLIWSQLHSFSLQYLLANGYNYAVVKIAIAMIIIGAFTKSAQFPFHEWLPDAMEGPTPISSFLHSSTMVKAGVFLIALLLPLISQYGMNYILLYFGIATAIIGALCAASESHIKRILAYSTIEDMGLMFVALGLNSIPAAIMLFFVQTFYKALLFLGSGVIMNANHGEENINKISGPYTSMSILIPIVIGAVSLAGIFPLSGFFGKAAIESAAQSTYVYLILLLVSLLSSIYIFRWLLVPLRHDKKKTRTPNYHLIPKSMLAPIYLLAIITIIASLAPIYLQNLSISDPLLSINYMEALLSLVIAAAGALFVYFIYYKRAMFQEKSRSIVTSAAYTSKYTNKAYEAITSSVYAIAGVVAGFERIFYRLVNQGGNGVKQIGSMMRNIESGNLNYYMLAFVLGMVAIILLIFVI